MAIEEIEISELELAEELAPDNLIPIESLTDTKATTLQKIKEWLGSFFVHKTGDEKIEGKKRFLNGIDINSVVGIFKGSYTKGTTPSSTQYWNVVFCDENGSDIKNRVGGIETRVVNDGSERTDLICFKNELNATSSERISIGYDSQGNVVTYAPAGSAKYSIVTTTGISKAQNGYVKLGNGIIIQWGKARVNNGTNITLPTPFSNTNYTVCITKDVTGAINASDGTGVRPVVGSKVASTTQFTAYNIWTSADSTYNATISWIAIGY